MGDMGISDSEDLLVTSMDGDHHLENFVGASLFTRKEGDLGTHFKLGHNRQHDEGGVGLVKANVGFSYDCYSPRDCFDDGYPLLIHTRQGVEGLGSYNEPFVNGSCFYAREDRVLCDPLNGQKSEECLNGAVVFDDKCRVFEEFSNEKDIESRGCGATSVGKFGISEECPIEDGSNGNKCNGTNADIYGNLKECSNYQVADTGSVQDAEIQKQGVGGVSADIQKEWADEKAVENNTCNGISAEKYQFGQSAGSVEDAKIQMHFTDGVSGECIPCNADGDLSAHAKSRNDLNTEVIEETHVCLSGSIDTDNATLVCHSGNLEQQASSITCAKTMGRQSSRQKKPTYSRKRAPRKISQKEENFVTSIGAGEDLVTTGISKGLDMTADGLMCSSSVVPSREQTSGTINEVNGKLQACSTIKDNDAVLSSNVNNNIGRITRSKAQGKLYLKSVVHDSLSDENNAIFAHKMTGKRSVLCKTTRSTVWGGLENIREGAEKTSITLKSDFSFTGTDFGERNIHSEVVQNQQLSKRRNGVRRQKPVKKLEYGQSELLDSPVFCSSINCMEKDDNLGRDGLQGQGFPIELKDSKMHLLNVQGGELLCTNDEVHSEGGILRHKDMGEEHKYLKAQNDQKPSDQLNFHLPHEVPKTLRNVEEENQAHGHFSKLDKMNTETEIPQFTMRRRGSGVKEQELGKVCDNEQLQHVEFPINGSSTHCENKENDDQEKGVLQGQSAIKESVISKGHGLNFKGSEVLCFSTHIRSGQGIGRQEKAEEEQICMENESKQCPNDQPNCCLPLEVPKSLGEIEGNNTVHGCSGDLCQKKVEDGVQPSQRGRKKRIGPKRQQPGKNGNNSRADQVKIYSHVSSRNCRKKKNAMQEKVVLWDEGFVNGTGGPEEHESSIQKSELLCLNGNPQFEGGIWRQNIDEENECLETRTDQFPINKAKCHSPIGFSESPTLLEENNRIHGHHSEQLVPIIMNESKCQVSSTVKTEASQQGSNENSNIVFHVIHVKENNVNPEEEAATSVRQTCAILTDDSIKSLEPNIVISKFEQQDEQKTHQTQIVTTEMHLRVVESGVSMEDLNLCTTEPKDNDLQDTVSATSHANTIERAAKQASRKRNGKDKEKLKGETKLLDSGVGLEHVTLGGPDISLDQSAVKKRSKRRCKNTEMKVTVRGRKSTSKKQRNIFNADSDGLVVHGNMLLREAERKVSCNLHENCNGEEIQTCVKVEPKADVNLENSLSHGKGQGRENLKKARGSNRKTEIIGSRVIHERKKNAARQTNIAGDKKILSRKSKHVCNGLQSSSRSNAGSGKNDASNTKTTGQGKTLCGIKGQLDFCIDALSPLNIAITSASGEQKNKEKHGLSSLTQGSAEKDVLKSKILERQGMTGCVNEVTGEDVSSVISEVEAIKILDKVNHDRNEERFCGSSRVGWVSCDNCQKWRRMPVEFIDAIDETKCKWTCQDNPNKEFADCTIPQEKSNAEINAELNISDVSCDEGDFNRAPSISKDHVSLQAQDSHQTSWTLIKRNVFLYRTHKTQVIDEIMVCHCKPPEDGSFGCGDECLNRMLNIECIKGTCPCGDLCSNQLFQKRQYSKVSLLRCGKKGFGLQILEEIPKGFFIIEYVGEVLDMQAYDTRQKEYALRGQKHFYFMTLSSNEVIDACVKGNLGRFINHSCDPNCRTEKWMVNGEVCIGLFAIRDIHKGEELTFDYNYERVFGAVAKKCECGSAECRGFIGGDQSTPTVVLPSEPDDEYPLPLMLHEESENDVAEEKNMLPPKTHNIFCENDGPEEKNMLPPKTHNIFCNVSQVEHPFQHAERKGQCSLAQHEKQAGICSNCGINESIGIPAMGNIFNLKKSIIRTNTGRFEGVEEKLNELLDSEGGISKRKDAARQYLKLLLVTAASGDTSNGEASHSTRDLSMILDALLKTRSRTVLIDIMNKNGLQMLHNLLKQNCGSYNKTPIIRKLLKVLEFLAAKDVLTIEDINSGPPCRGRESFKASICALIGHNDWQVQQIARSFRDNWIFHSIKTFKSRERSLSNEPALTVSDHPNNRSKFSIKRQKNLIPRDTDAIDCTSQTVLEPENDTQSPSTWSDHYEGIHDTHDNITGKDDNISGKDINKNMRGNRSFDSQMRGTVLRKRKSRWDQPTEPIVHESFAQMALGNAETKIKQGKESGSVIDPSEALNVPGLRQDGFVNELYSEEKSMNRADINIPCQDSVVQTGKYSISPSEEMSITNGSEAFTKLQSSVQSTMELIAQLPSNAHSCMASICASSCSTERPSAQPYIMGYPQGKTAFGYETWKPHGSIPTHLTLSFGIPFFFLEQSRRAPYAKADCVGQPLSSPNLHCKPINNSVAPSMLQNISFRPFVGQPILRGFPHNPNNQGRPTNIPLQTHSIHSLKIGKQQTLEMHPRDLMGQYPSAISDYVDPEPPVPGLSPRGSLESLHYSNHPVRGRNKTTYDQTLKPCKGQWKNQKPNSRLFSKFNGYPNKKYKDGFHRRKSFSFKSTCKDRFPHPANFHSDQNLHNVPNGNILDLGKEQKLENMNFVNLSKDVSKNFPTFH